MIRFSSADAALVLLVLAAGCGLGSIAQTDTPPIDPPPRAPTVFASPIHGGCYLTGSNRCVVHAEPFTINVAAGQSLVAYQLVLNGVVVYDWKPDQSNPPVGNYSPTLVKRDLAAYCGRTYNLALYGRDSGDASMFVLGQTAAFTCPSCGAAAPANVTGLVIAPDHKTIHWTLQSTGTSYSVVKGDLGLLLSNGGSFPRSITACLLPDSVAASAVDTASPPVRGGFYYLVRARNCSGDTGSYDDGPGLLTSRDAGIAASASRCP